MDHTIKALTEAEAALGENLVWITDQVDLLVRRKDAETMRRLQQMNQAWVTVCRALKQVAA